MTKTAASAQEHLDALRLSPHADNLEAFVEQLQSDGLRGALKYLNNATPHRFTGVFRFDGEMLRSVELVDKWQGGVTRGEDIPIAAAYCAHLHDTGEAALEVTDGAMDSRTPWMAGSGIRSYSGALIRDSGGRPWGAVCHFDADPCEETRSGLPLLVGAAALLYRPASLQTDPIPPDAST